jgi:hypothetical protein
MLKKRKREKIIENADGMAAKSKAISHYTLFVCSYVFS